MGMRKIWKKCPSLEFDSGSTTKRITIVMVNPQTFSTDQWWPAGSVEEATEEALLLPVRYDCHLCSKFSNMQYACYGRNYKRMYVYESINSTIYICIRERKYSFVPFNHGQSLVHRQHIIEENEFFQYVISIGENSIKIQTCMIFYYH